MAAAGKQIWAPLCSEDLLLHWGKNISSSTAGLMPSNCIFMVPGFSWTLGRAAEVYSALFLPIILEGFSWGIHVKEKGHLNGGSSRQGSLSWTLDSSRCTDLHRDAWRQPGPGCHSPVIQKTSPCSVLWCQCRDMEPAGSKATNKISRQIDSREEVEMQIPRSPWLILALTNL